MRTHAEKIKHFNNLEVRNTENFNKIFVDSPISESFQDIEVSHLVRDSFRITRVLEVDGDTMHHNFSNSFVDVKSYNKRKNKKRQIYNYIMEKDGISKKVFGIKRAAQFLNCTTDEIKEYRNTEYLIRGYKVIGVYND